MHRLVSVFVILVSVLAKESAFTAPMTREAIDKLSLKKIRRMLDERNIDCEHCEQKSDYGDQLFENQHVPVSRHQKSKERKTSSAKKTPQDEANIQEVLEQMRMQGFGDATVYRPSTIDDLTPEELSKRYGKQAEDSMAGYNFEILEKHKKKKTKKRKKQ
mmetsp:Transcript_9520/g.14325  ORF Transcript_9520/g.14325 Transcript_9520/m.14325 type:complete len:160 (-) Transcript_9520:102-581(-)|eukprot:CAMPEP_0185027914 /NCGR_PEP_ID=MMETSP1103-20130426/13235_1 /TAXON_ID=36769 /ORGANISM="Paraphysomonas bandaiensis, Strain Caron Lab Isolate" /LENGTH=159 /DNA_ID=CAMNT_0027562103 /DNA_START=106 /DNA_END=585 /DNA_ORIENTATION=-